MSERCLHNEVCKYGDARSNGMYCTEEKCKQFKNRNKYAEVVRCKDCKHWTMGYCNHFAYYSYEPITSADDFCSYGERKDNGI